MSHGADVAEHLLDHPEDPEALRAAHELLRSASRPFLRAVERRHQRATAARTAAAAAHADANESPWEWHNVARTHVNHPKNLYRPRSIEDVKCVVRTATRARRRVRPVAMGHSYSDILCGADVLVDMSAFQPTDTGLLPLEEETWRVAVPDETLVRVAAGAKIRTLSASLRTVGLGFSNLGGFAGQTLVGAITTSTHGSGARLPPFPDAVRSIDIVMAGGQPYRIEPSDGPTDRTKFERRPHPEGLALIQNDDVFWSVVVSLGSMGIVTSMVVRVGPAFRLRQRRVESRWSEAKRLLADGRSLTDHRHVEFWLHPYPEDGDHRCLITRRDLAPPDDAARRDGTRWGRDRVMTLPPTRRFNEWIVSRPCLNPAFAWLLDQCPGLVDGTLNLSLDTVLEPPLLVQHAESMFDIGSPNDAPTLSSEFCVKTAGAIAGMDCMLDIAGKLRASGRGLQTSPFSMRFTAPSKAYLSMMYCRDTATLEAPMLRNTENGAATLVAYERALYCHGARPHWGQGHELTGAPGWLFREYEKAGVWRDVKQKYDPHGTFDNHFTDRLRLSSGGHA